MDLKTLVPLILHWSVILIVMSVGMRAQWQDLLFAAKRPVWLFRGVIAVNLVVPLVATLVVVPLPMEPAIKIGIVIMSVSPLAPLVTHKLIKAGAEPSFAVGLHVALIMIAVVMVPATLALLDAMFPVEMTISIVAIAGLMFSSILVPLFAGLLTGSLAPRYASMIARGFSTVGNVGLLCAATAVIFVQASNIFSLVGNGSVLAIVITVAAGLLAGHQLGGPSLANRKALALAAASRHPGIAGLIIQQNFEDRRVMLAVMLFVVTSTVVAAIYELWTKRTQS